MNRTRHRNRHGGSGPSIADIMTESEVAALSAGSAAALVTAATLDPESYVSSVQEPSSSANNNLGLSQTHASEPGRDDPHHHHPPSIDADEHAKGSSYLSNDNLHKTVPFSVWIMQEPVLLIIISSMLSFFATRLISGVQRIVFRPGIVKCCKGIATKHARAYFNGLESETGTAVTISNSDGISMDVHQNHDHGKAEAGVSYGKGKCCPTGNGRNTRKHAAAELTVLAVEFAFGLLIIYFIYKTFSFFKKRQLDKKKRQ